MTNERRTQRRVARQAAREAQSRLSAVQAAQYAIPPADGYRPSLRAWAVALILFALLVGLVGYAGATHVPKEYVQLHRTDFQAKAQYHGWREFVRRFGLKGIPSGCNAGTRVGTDGTEGWHYMLDCPLGLKLIPSGQ